MSKEQGVGKSERPNSKFRNGRQLKHLKHCDVGGLQLDTERLREGMYRGFGVREQFCFRVRRGLLTFPPVESSGGRRRREGLGKGVAARRTLTENTTLVRKGPDGEVAQRGHKRRSRQRHDPSDDNIGGDIPANRGHFARRADTDDRTGNRVGS